MRLQYHQFWQFESHYQATAVFFKDKDVKLAFRQSQMGPILLREVMSGPVRSRSAVVNLTDVITKYCGVAGTIKYRYVSLNIKIYNNT